jgi:hypothetical protein
VPTPAVAEIASTSIEASVPQIVPSEAATNVQKDAESSKQIISEPVDAPPLSSRGTCQPGEAECGAADNAQPTPAPKKKRQSRLQELQQVVLRTSLSPSQSNTILAKLSRSTCSLQAREDLKTKEQELLQKTAELQEKDQSIAILREEVCELGLCPRFAVDAALLPHCASVLPHGAFTGLRARFPRTTAISSRKKRSHALLEPAVCAVGNREGASRSAREGQREG